MPDPIRSHRRYREARKAWLPTADPVCVLERCVAPSRAIDITLPHGHPWAPTVEHTVAVRDIKRMTSTLGEALDLACDTRLWAMAHWKCQQLQGASAGGTTIAQRRSRLRRRGSRDWYA